MLTILDRTDPPMIRAGGGRYEPLFLVVGYDGTPVARDALVASAEMIHGRSGHLEVVFVIHVPGWMASAPMAASALRLTLTDQARNFEAEVRRLLDDHEPRWHFQDRTGNVAAELTEVARTTARRHHAIGRTSIVVGASSHRLHRTFGSVPGALTRASSFSVTVIASTNAAAKRQRPASKPPGEPCPIRRR